MRVVFICAVLSFQFDIQEFLDKSFQINLNQTGSNGFGVCGFVGFGVCGYCPFVVCLLDCVGVGFWILWI